MSEREYTCSDDVDVTITGCHVKSLDEYGWKGKTQDAHEALELVLWAMDSIAAGPCTGVPDCPACCAYEVRKLALEILKGEAGEA